MSQSPFEAALLLPSNFRVRCGSGEGEGDGDGSTTKTTETETDGDGNTKTTETEDVDLEGQLDQERSARIQLQRERDEANDAKEAAIRETQEEGDRVAAERDDYKKKYEKLKGLMETSYLTNAIVQQYQPAGEDGKGGKGFNFHDAEAVRTFLNPKQIRLDLDTGKVEGLDVELKRIAKEKPYLVKQPEEQQSGGSSFVPPPGSTGQHPRNGGANRERVTDKNKLGSKYKMPGFAGFSGKAM